MTYYPYECMQCLECGLRYVPAEPEDRAEHRKVHKRFMASQAEVGPIIPYSHAPDWEKVWPRVYIEPAEPYPPGWDEIKGRGWQIIHNPQSTADEVCQATGQILFSYYCREIWVWSTRPTQAPKFYEWIASESGREIVEDIRWMI